MEKLSAYFEQNGFSGADLEQILAAFTFKAIQKDDLFAEFGAPCSHLGFVENGLFQYYILTNGIESTSYVASENCFLVSLVGFLNQVPAQENIRAITNGAVWMINKSDIAALIKDVPRFKDFYIAMLEWHICAIDRSRNDLIRLSAEQRYEKMLREEPQLLQHIPLQYLAAILGVTPRHLSRIRKNFR